MVVMLEVFSISIRSANSSDSLVHELCDKTDMTMSCFQALGTVILQTRTKFKSIKARHSLRA